MIKKLYIDINIHISIISKFKEQVNGAREKGRITIEDIIIIIEDIMSHCFCCLLGF